ncbi:MAG TPA: hypothetical protein PLZ53_05015 [Candidatus Hydrogenedentes bacterium]|jgi:hypothetical protein|nr:MAG: hypothetical protein BWY07_01593 [Candidatus Hydrogenedentes bacterium ADurb.Bin170]HNZ48523.1 hypothetical protein [Candidatus Hydrogenedentota bacterium]HOD95553.1 hypothetical protein [Candidatus Hydrogenedentota bacterium]HOH42454.1 hypothetical protein [Candidatus Hydrogenedentota bacterium]HOR51001.1 hypothetical protein [Candidatus Hydrogenedentota bacterium]
MKVGIYMPFGERGKSASSLFYDGLEKEYFRRALGAVHAQKAYSDMELLWFDEGGNPSPCAFVRTTAIEPVRSSLSLFKSSSRLLEKVVQDEGLDVLLTHISTPLLRLSIPQILFTADMLFHGETRSVSNTPPPPLSSKIKRACMSAQSILCPSEYVHRSCLSRLEMGLEKAIVAKAGVDKIFSEPSPSLIDPPYGLFILNRYTFPALPTFFNAIQKNTSLFPQNLVVLGPVHPEEPSNWPLPVVRIENCPDKEVAGLMQNAEMCFYLAHGDGSGIPVLQALSSGALLITTRSGAINEVAGSVPFYCEADNITSLLNILRRAKNEKASDLRKRKQTAQNLIHDCSWERCGTKILSTLKRSQLNS